MAQSKYEYVRKYELDDTLLLGCYIVVRIDGKGFTKFCENHGFDKPNDKRALDVMDAAALDVLQEYPDIRMAYGESDEYSFILHKQSELYGRRASKLVSLITSCFTASYVRKWPTFLPDQPLLQNPIFDGRAICYPDLPTVKDYLCWRQVDTHVNNLYNTCFWALVKDGCTPVEAQETLKGTDSGQKNELLYSRFGINYNQLPEQLRKGSVVLWEKRTVVVKHREDGTPVERERRMPVVLHCDIIGADFWKQRPGLLD